MIDFLTIEKNLIKIEKLYNDSTDSTDSTDLILYSKLAILEFSGWLEESFDEVLYNYLYRQNSANYIKWGIRIIKNNHSVSWDKNRSMINSIIGISNLELIESLIDMIGGIDIISSILKNLSRDRNDAAHKSTPVFRVYNAPSVTFDSFRQIKPILTEMEILIQYL